MAEYEHLGELIREAREVQGLTQQQLADAVGTGRAYISQIESGDRDWPKKYIPALSRVLGLDLDMMKRIAGRPYGASLKASARITSEGRATLTVPTSSVVGNATRQFLDSLTDKQRVDLLGLINDAAKLSHAEDYQEEDDEDAEKESHMAH